MKIIAFVAAILSAATVATLAFTTVPSIQKQAADNAAAIETLGGTVSDNAEAIENLTNKKYYLHTIEISDSVSIGTFSIILNTNEQINTFTKILSLYDEFSFSATGNFIVGDNVYNIISINKTLNGANFAFKGSIITGIATATHTISSVTVITVADKVHELFK